MNYNPNIAMLHKYATEVYEIFKVVRGSELDNCYWEGVWLIEQEMLNGLEPQDLEKVILEIKTSRKVIPAHTLLSELQDRLTL